MSTSINPTSMKNVKKAVIYVLRKSSNGLEVLVFDHVKYPEVSPQVPSGTVEIDEDILSAAKRELFEESGLELSQEFHFLGSYDYLKTHVNQLQQRNHFLIFSDDLKDEWIHCVTGDGEDQKLDFKYYWLPVERAKKNLQVNLGDGLDLFKQQIQRLSQEFKT